MFLQLALIHYKSIKEAVTLLIVMASYACIQLRFIHGCMLYDCMLVLIMGTDTFYSKSRQLAQETLCGKDSEWALLEGNS